LLSGKTTVKCTLSALLFEEGLPSFPVVLIEPHRNPGGVWRHQI
jgi:hypothetical protein